MAVLWLPSPAQATTDTLGKGAERRHRDASKKIQGKVLVLNLASVFHPVPSIVLVTAGSGLSLPFSFSISPSGFLATSSIAPPPPLCTTLLFRLALFPELDM